MTYKSLRLWLLLSLGAIAAHAAPVGYIVKVDGKKVFLDLLGGNGAAPGKEFTVFTEGDRLKHPVTGADMGPVEKTIASGRIVEVHDKYSLGELSADAAVAPGQKVRLADASAAPAAQAAAPAS